MKTTESIVKIASALLKAQKNIKTVQANSENNHFQYKYADLASVIEACKKPLNDEGISILQAVEGTSVETILLHESGEYISCSVSIVSKDPNDPQKMGSAITYAKRYGLQSLVLLPTDDDDGNGAATPIKKSSTPPPSAIPSQATDVQKNNIRKLLAELGKTEKGLCTALKIESLDKITFQMAVVAMKKLEEKKKNTNPASPEDIDPESLPPDL